MGREKTCLDADLVECLRLQGMLNEVKKPLEELGVEVTSDIRFLYKDQSKTHIHTISKKQATFRQHNIRISNRT